MGTGRTIITAGFRTVQPQPHIQGLESRGCQCHLQEHTWDNCCLKGHSASARSLPEKYVPHSHCLPLNSRLNSSLSCIHMVGGTYVTSRTLVQGSLKYNFEFLVSAVRRPTSRKLEWMLSRLICHICHSPYHTPATSWSFLFIPLWNCITI